MRVAAINRSIYNRTTFRGLFQNTPNISDRFRFGLEALDNNSILTVTSNSESSDMMLELYSDKIISSNRNKQVMWVSRPCAHKYVRW